MVRAAKWIVATFALMVVAAGILVLVGCGDKGTSPKISGTLPYSLDGTWHVTDEAALSCYASFNGDLVGTYTDTICVAVPDFGVASADETWKMFVHYGGILPGRWTDPVWDTWWVTLDSTVNAFFAGHASSTLEQCDFKVRIYLAGAFDGDQWRLKRTIERVEGRACGHHGDDTTLFCDQYITIMERIGDAPEDCVSSDDVIGSIH